MRIISGKFKRKKLLTPRNQTIRPTADKHRESLFNILTNNISGATVLDLFAGTGAMGIEAISRGAQFVVFIDKDIRLLMENIKRLNIDNETQVIRWDIFRNLSCIKGKFFDIIIMDPPYRDKHIEKTLYHLMDSQCIKTETVIVAEHSVRDDILIPEGLERYESRHYGKTQFSFLRLQ